jgi:hypothetical protein
MKIRSAILYSIFLVLPFAAKAQFEKISPLNSNPELTIKLNHQKMLADIFVYEIDTIRIPFKDDFSSDKFKKYDAQPGDANVTSQTDYLLYDDLNTTVLPDTVEFSLTPTYLITYDTVGTDTTIFTALDSVQITVYDLSVYPYAGTLQWVWPPYYIYDTLFAPPADTVLLTPDLIQDSVYTHFVAATDNGIWQDNFAYRNSRFPINPPTVGVVTFDGLDETGYPYDFSSQTTYGIADYLTSKPINLGFDIFANPYLPADSIYLSFYYQPTGRGEEPDGEDSLFLEFWSPFAADWFRVWSIPGMDDDSTFKQEIILVDPTFLQNGFKFRFGNYAALSGSIDHWHIDYVFLNEFRTRVDTVRDDVAYQYVPSSLLNQYSAVPWAHYKWNPSLYMADTLSTFQRNNADAGHLIGNNFMEINYEGANLNSFPHPNNPSIAAFTNYTTLWDVGLQPFMFDTTVNDTCATFEVTFRHQATPDFERENDTVRLNQVFENYYAYDDGSAEWAYGLYSAGAKLAYKFDLMQADSIRAIQIYFHPDVINVQNDAFLLTIWDATGSSGKPGNIIYQNSNYNSVDYIRELNGFKEYYLDDTILLNAGAYYIGMQQLDADPLNIGMDFNTDRKSKIYYNVGGSWFNTSFKGALMMRPVFATLCDQLLAEVKEEIISEPILVYPNPANDQLTIDSDENEFAITLSDITGRTVLNTVTNSNKLNVSEFTEGIYILQISIPRTGETSVQKILIRR